MSRRDAIVGEGWDGRQHFETAASFAGRKYELQGREEGVRRRNKLRRERPGDPVPGVGRVGPHPERQGQRPVQKSLGKLVKPSSRARDDEGGKGKETGGEGGDMGKRLRVAEKKDVLLINDSLYPVLVWRRNGSAKTAIGQSGRGDKKREKKNGTLCSLVGSQNLDGFFFLAATLKECDTSRRETRPFSRTGRGRFPRRLCDHRVCGGVTPSSADDKDAVLQIRLRFEQREEVNPEEHRI